MSQSGYRVRRATIDDLQEMQRLWVGMHYSPIDLEKRLTDFQVAESDDGRLLGAVAMEIAGRQGKIHSECFSDFGLAEPLRQHLWERLQSLATNHGLARIWTRETAPFWAQNGFHQANEDALKKLPEPWAGEQSGWLTLKLRDEEALHFSLEKEFARFKEQELARTGGTLRGVKALKFFSTLVAVVLSIFVVVVCIYVFLHRAALRPPGH